MKILRNIIIVLVVLGLIAAGIVVLAPNYRKDPNKGKTNLVINYTNVTSSMKGKVIVKDKNVYICIDDIENYYDRYIHYDEKHNYVIITKDGKTVCFDIDNGTMDINGDKQNAQVVKEDGKYYLPINKLEDIYNIKVSQKDDKSAVVIDSLDRQLETATITKKTKVRYKRTVFSKSLEKLNVGDKVAIVPNRNNVGYTYIRTESGKIGYVKDGCLSKPKIEREETKKTDDKGNEKISMVWETFEFSAPVVTADTKYDGVNVVSPTFLYMDSSTVKDKIDSNGINYINWAKSNNYKIWAVISNNNYTEEKMNQFSEWINDYEKRKSVINQIVEYTTKYNFDGINVDFENIYIKDKSGLTRFVIELDAALENVDKTLSVDVTEPDGSDNWSLCYNRNVIGDVSDYIVFMAYDQHGRGSSTAGPTAACYWVERNLDKFAKQEEVDTDKIILGIPFYTILWKEKDGVVNGTSITQRNIRIPEGAEVTWLEDSKQNYAEYNQNGYLCKIWIEDKEATSQKLDIISKYDLAGAAFWAKGYEDKDVWSIVKEKLK